MASDTIHKSFYALDAVQDCKDIKLNIYDVKKSTCLAAVGSNPEGLYP